MTWARIGTTALLMATALVLGAGSDGPAAATTAKQPRTLVSIGAFRASVSPNGDGFHDRIRIPFTVRQRSSVSARVTNLDTHRTVYDGCVPAAGHDCDFRRGTYALGLRDLRAGAAHSWEPGTYRVRLTARSYAGVESGQAQTRFDLLPGAVRAERRRLAFSPDGDGVRDRARIAFLIERRSRVAAFLYPESDAGPVGAVRLGLRERGRGAWTWDGRVGDVVVPDGTYRLQLRARPVVGTHRTLGRDELVLLVRGGPGRPAGGGQRLGDR